MLLTGVTVTALPPAAVAQSAVAEDGVEDGVDAQESEASATERVDESEEAPRAPISGSAAIERANSAGAATTRGTAPMAGPTFGDRLWMNYFNIFYGPPVTELSRFQATPTGVRDDNRPLLLENFLTLGYDLDEHWTVSGTAHFLYVPVAGQEMILRDPFVKLSNNSVFSTSTINLYADVRLHFPVTFDSRQQDLRAGFQALIHPTWTPAGGRLTLGVWTWGRYNLFGPQGAGDDFEFYFGPNAFYSLSPTFALTLLLESGGTHEFGAPAFRMRSVQADIEPGFSWDITPQLNFSPYLNIFLGREFSWRTTGLGATVSWMLF